MGKTIVLSMVPAIVFADFNFLNSTPFKLAALEYDFWEICRGHDLVKVFQFVFSSGYNCLSYGREAFNDKELARFIRGAYEEKWFTTTNMYRNLDNWQRRKKVELLNVV